MKILIACEFSGTIRDRMIKLGHDCVSCDILPCESDLKINSDGFIVSDKNPGMGKFNTNKIQKKKILTSTTYLIYWTRAGT